MVPLESRLHEAILGRFHEAGVEIMSPLQASIRDGNARAIPEQVTPRPAGSEKHR